MKILPPEPAIDLYNETFTGPDILNRVNTGKALTDLLDRIDDPLVVALDGQWGTGKTYFLKRWVGAHTIDNGSKATTVYFDAFAHDYLSDPLPALVSALTARIPSGKEAKVQKVKAAAYKLAKPLARMGLNVATFGATEALDNFGDAVVGAMSGEATAGLEKFWEEEDNRRTAMVEFKKAIETLASPSEKDGMGSSLVIVIDELDRCRPDYALEVLEVIKHFFSVPRVHFVLGVNLRALENSVKVRYGKDIDAQAYLKKFIQISLELPNELGDIHNSVPANLVYLEYLIREMDVPQHIAENLQNQVKLVSHFNEISMRDIGRIVSSLSLASNDVLTRDKTFPGMINVMIDLVIAKTVRPDLYPKFLSGTINETELASYIGATQNRISETINGEHNPEFNRNIWWNYLTWMYLTQNGKLSSKDSLYMRGIDMQDIGRQFGTIGPRDPRSLPREVHLRWLDQFSFYVP